MQLKFQLRNYGVAQGACAPPAKVCAPLGTPIQNFETNRSSFEAAGSKMFKYWHAPLEKVVHPL